MEVFLQDTTFYWIIWSVATLIGVLLGWSLRYIFSEKKMVRALERSEQDRNALARLYTQLKHQYDLREADMKKNAIEVAQLRNQVKEFELMRTLNESEKQTEKARLDKVEAHNMHLLEKTALLDAQSKALRNRNAQMAQELKRRYEEINAWKRLHRDFAAIQRQLRSYEKAAGTLEQERRQLNEQLKAARLEIENLQLELVKRKGTFDQYIPPTPPTPPPPQEQQTLQTPQVQGERPGYKREMRPSSPDDLKIINGVTPFIEQQLNALGVFSFDQLSRWDDAAVISMARALSVSPARILEEDWIGQARHLLEQSR